MSSGQVARSNSLKRRHWSIRAHESLICRNKDGHFCLNVEGGAERGLLPHVGELRQDRINYRSGKLHPGEVILEVNHKRVPGMIKKDVIALIKRSADPVSLVTVKQNATITKDIRQYLSTRFSKGSVDSEMQHQIRENLHTRSIPCTTRQPKDGERQGIDYNFVSVEEFKRMEKNGELLESGLYENNYYGTPKPPADPPSSSAFPAYARSPVSTGYIPREALMPLESLSPPGSQGPRVTTRVTVPQNPGPLPSNWEIAYTETNEKYFIDHNTGTTHWMDPRFARSMKHSLLECEDDELPYGWEKVNDPVYGVYYIDHVNRSTQYDNPVIEAKRKYLGSQLPPRGGYQSEAPPPLHAPPSFQTAAALEKQREAEAAAKWPEAGLRDFVDYPAQGYQANPQDIEANLQGEMEKVLLTKNPTGFGFTIIGGDRPGELLQIRNIVRGGVADRDGRLKVGDVLVRVNGEPVVTYSHHKVVELFQSIPLHSDVELEIRRGYPLPDYQRDELPSYSDANINASSGYAPDPVRRFSSEPEQVMVNIVKGPLGFGFSLSETHQGPTVKQIMDIPRCAQLRVNDLIVEVNGEKITNYSHNDFVTLLKRCQKGNQARFLVLRTAQPNDATHGSQFFNGGMPLPSASDEPFQQMDIRLMRQVSGFGFRIIGGKEEGSQATVGGIVSGGAADLDGRLLVGDEITSINGYSVVDGAHREVIQLMGEAGAIGEVTIGIRRKMPRPSSKPSFFPDDSMGMSGGMFSSGPREIVIHRPNLSTSFGFVLQSNTLRTGCMICRLIAGSPAEMCGQLQLYDELLMVNDVDVSQMDHGDIVQQIKNSSTSIKLIVQQPDDKDKALQLQQFSNTDQPMQSAMAVPVNTFADGPSRYGYQDGGEDVPQISADLDDIASDDEEIGHIEIQRDGTGFGFSIRGGAEYNSPLYVLRIAEGGAAERDNRLQVGDELLDINGNSTEGMMHSDAITIIKHGGEVVKLIIRRVMEHNSYHPHKGYSPGSFGGSPVHDSSLSHGGFNSHSREMLNDKSPAVSTHERYAKDYMNSLGRSRPGVAEQYVPNEDDHVSPGHTSPGYTSN